MMNRIRRFLINHFHHGHAPFAIAFHERGDTARQFRGSGGEAKDAFRLFGGKSVLDEFFQPGSHRFFTALNPAENVGDGPSLRGILRKQTENFQLLNGLDMPSDEFLEIVE